MNEFTLIFDDVIVKQLKKAAKNQQVRTVLTRLLNKIDCSVRLQENFWTIK